MADSAAETTLSTPASRRPPSHAGPLLQLLIDCTAVVGACPAVLCSRRAKRTLRGVARCASCPGAHPSPSQPDSLEKLVRSARSYREKCAVLLGAALNSKLALEQVAEAATRQLSQEEGSLLLLRRLCTKLLLALRQGEIVIGRHGR